MTAPLARRLRIPLGFVLAALYLLFARPTFLSLLLGAAVAFVGLLIRAWASGHILKNDELATTGPYAHTRNPLYFGSFLLAAGFALAAHWSLVLLVVAFFIAVYGPTIEHERITVRERFGSSYDEWARHVPSFFPRPLPWRRDGSTASGFDFGLYMRHGEWKAALGYLGALAVLVIRMRAGI